MCHGGEGIIKLIYVTNIIVCTAVIRTVAMFQFDTSVIKVTP